MDDPSHVVARESETRAACLCLAHPSRDATLLSTVASRQHIRECARRRLRRGKGGRDARSVIGADLQHNDAA
eukprot:357293-Chlamydomonas_euryale.AAC.1